MWHISGRTLIIENGNGVSAVAHDKHGFQSIGNENG
jgi:hypothetical protein